MEVKKFLTEFGIVGVWNATIEINGVDVDGIRVMTDNGKNLGEFPNMSCDDIESVQELRKLLGLDY